MTNLTSSNSESSNEKNSSLMAQLWGESWKKLNPKQRQLVSEVLGRLNQRNIKAEN